MKHAMTKMISTIMLVGLAGTIPIAARDQNQVEDCSKELLLSYFPAPFVSKAFEKFKVDRQKWPAILRELAERDKDVVRTVEEKAVKMSPNPLRDAKHRQEAVRLFRETLYSIFSSVMEKNGITDSDQIHRMLDDIQFQKANHFAQCMEKQKQEQTRGNTSDASDDWQDQAPDQDEDNMADASDDDQMNQLRRSADDEECNTDDFDDDFDD